MHKTKANRWLIALSVAALLAALAILVRHRKSEIVAVAPMITPRNPADAVTPVAGIDERQATFLELGRQRLPSLIFLGDSITDYFQWAGKAVWDAYYERFAVDFGVSGERTEHVLGRIQHGLLERLHPKVVILLIGINNLGCSLHEKPEWVASGIAKIVALVHEKLPAAKVLLLGIFPAEARSSPMRERLRRVNTLIARLDDGRMTRYLDIGPRFLDPNGNIPEAVMPDGLHPSARGYAIWAESMQPLLDEMMK